jgi:hypothetical protein
MAAVVAVGSVREAYYEVGPIVPPRAVFGNGVCGFLWSSQSMRFVIHCSSIRCSIKQRRYDLFLSLTIKWTKLEHFNWGVLPSFSAPAASLYKGSHYDWQRNRHRSRR